jgi:hypothetical protein
MDGNINTLFTSLATTIRNVSVAVGVFAFMWGAIQYATSGGSPHQLEVGKAAMKASLIGVGAVVLAATLVGIVFGALGGGAAVAAHWELSNQEWKELPMDVSPVLRLIGNFTDAARAIAPLSLPSASLQAHCSFLSRTWWAASAARNSARQAWLAA